MKSSYGLHNSVYGQKEQLEKEKHLWKGAPISKQAHGKFGLDSEIKQVFLSEC